MGSQVLIVDSDPIRRAALRSGLALPEGEVADLADPRDLAGRVARSRPDLLLLDAGDGDGDAALQGLRELLARPGLPLPAIALVPANRPELRLAALAAGVDDATDRGTGPRLLQTRIRSLLRQRNEALGLAPAENGREIAWPGLAERPAVFSHAVCHPRARVALLSAWPKGASPGRSRVPPPRRRGRPAPISGERKGPPTTS